MISLLHLRSTQGLYGADKALLALAAATPSPYVPIVGTLARPGRPDLLADEAERMGLRSLRLPSASKLDFSSASALAKEVRSSGIRLIHAHDYKSLAVALVARTMTGVRVVATYHGDTAASLSLRAYEAFARLCGNGTQGVAAVSRPLQQKLASWVKLAPVKYLPNGVPPAAPLSAEERAEARAAFSIPSDALAIGVLGRLSVEKGHPVLVEALRAMAQPPVTLLAGDGPLRGALEASSSGLPIRFLGFISNTRAVYAASDLVVLPSLTEGLPMVALEAMVLGRAVLATSVGELPQVLGGGVGRLVPPGNATALAEQMTAALADRGALDSMAEAGRARVDASYSARAMAEGYVRGLYVPALQELGSSPRRKRQR